MSCWSADPGDPTDVCNATVVELLDFLAQRYPTVVAVAKVVLVASMVLSLGVAAGAVLVAWRRRLTARLERREMAAAVAVVQARVRARRPGPVYPVRCTTAVDTVRLRRGAGGALRVDEDGLG